MMLICVTNRTLCKPDHFLKQVQWIAQAKPDAILLREKDLSLQAYQQLADQVREICEAYDIPLILHHFLSTPSSVTQRWHLPYETFLSCISSTGSLWHPHPPFGVSVHTIEQALFAYQHGAEYLIAGHIFSTACKSGSPPQGLSFLHDICKAVPIPVYAIGGITPPVTTAVLAQGASGICIMSEIMQSPQPATTLQYYRQAML